MNQQIICSNCGTWYPVKMVTPICPICADDRQYVPERGQQWTLPEDLLNKHSVKINKKKQRLYELTVNPHFAIGQRALLVLSEQGNVLWDCVPLLDELTIEFIRAKGGLAAIAFSHPHYYSNMNDWADTFDCPVYIHKNDAGYIQVGGSRIKLWEGEKLELWEGMRIMLIGGHFDGSSILHVPFLSPEGSILCGDTLFLSPSKKHFSILRSYPNRIPLPLSEMKRLKDRFDDIPFDVFYGYEKSQNLDRDVKRIFTESMQRYLS